jgi:hypothetical protein
MVIETSRPIARVAKELGINEGTLGKHHRTSAPERRIGARGPSSTGTGMSAHIIEFWRSCEAQRLGCGLADGKSAARSPGPSAGRGSAARFAAHPGSW